MNVDSTKNQITPQRAPLEREAPVPLRGPLRPRRNPQERPGEPLNDLFKNRDLQFDQGTGFHSGPSKRRKRYEVAMWSLLATLIDGLILIALTSCFLIAFSFVTKTSSSALVHSLVKDQHQVLLFFEVFCACGWIYMLVLRTIMGATLGEWSCELRLGQPQERLSATYGLRVALRSTLILITGVLPLPVISLIVGRDLPGAISGLKLYSLK